MRWTNGIRLSVLCGLLMMASAVPAMADGGAGAAAAIGVLAGVGVGSQAMTSSELEVKVEMFDAAQLKDHFPTDFILPNGTSLHRAMIGQKLDPDVQPSLYDMKGIETFGRPKAEKLRKAGAAVGETADKLAKEYKAATLVPNSDVNSVLSVFRAQSSLASGAAAAFDDFAAAVDKASKDAANVDAQKAAFDKLKIVRSKLSDLAGMTVSAQYNTFMQGGIRTGLEEAKLSEAHRSAFDSSAALKPNSMSDLLFALATTLRTAQAELTPAATSTVNAHLDALGLSVTVSDLLNYTSPVEIQASLPQIAATFQVKGTSQTLLNITYDTINAAINLGPITNEAMQMIYTRPIPIGIVTDPKNEKLWHEVAHAKSSGGTGNHDTVIYFENLGMPVVKTSTFDPTKFVVAYGALYKRAFSVAADVFGVPMDASGTPSAGTASGGSQLNLINAKARAQNSDKAAADAKAAVAAAARKILDLQDSIKTAGTDKDKLNAAIDKAKTDLQAAVTKLKAAAGTSDAKPSGGATPGSGVTPVTPAPVTPAPVTPAPVTPAPVTPAPVTPAPVTPAPASNPAP